MLEGLKETQEALKERGIPLSVRRGSPDEVALDASLIVTDRGYLRPQREWRKNVAEKAGCRMVQVESEVVVPVERASGKAETVARTLRPKIQKHLDRFLVGLKDTPIEKQSTDIRAGGLDLSDLDAVLDEMDLDRSVEPVGHLYWGGTSRAKEILDDFIQSRFDTYAENRNQPQTNDVSHMSKYLHFGQISPVYIALEIQDANASGKNTDSYLEELIVRRELPMNFVYYTPEYDSYACLPG